MPALGTDVGIMLQSLLLLILFLASAGNVDFCRACLTVGKYEWLERHQTLIAVEWLIAFVPVLKDPQPLRRLPALLLTMSSNGTPTIPRSLLYEHLDSRLKNVESLAIATSTSLKDRDVQEFSEMLVAQSKRISDEQLRADTAGQRSLMFARLGFGVSLCLALILLRERWRLRRANHRLNAEIRNATKQRQEKERIELRLAQTERLESLGALAGGIAHDFNNLLVGMIGNADLLKRIEPISSSGIQFLDGIIRSAETAAGLSRKMLAYAGRQPTSKTIVDLNDNIERMLPLLRAGLGGGHPIQFCPCAEVLLTEGDAEQLDQILMNLVTNSSQAMDGTFDPVVISTGLIMLDEVPLNIPTFGSRKTGGRFVWFEVADQGPGVSEADLARVFEPFFTTKGQSSGHGFGLAVVYGNVNRHDGFVQIISVPGQGCRFRILLPQSRVATEHPVSQVPRVRTTMLAQGINIVAVDDQPDVLDVVSHTVEMMGGHVTSFTNAMDAMEYLIENKSVDCLLLDIMMPVLDGPAMLEELSNKGIRIPVVMMSGYSAENPEMFAHMSAVHSIVQKPFRPEDLIKTLRAAMVVNAHSANTDSPENHSLELKP